LVSQETVFQAQANVDNNQFVTVQLLSENEVQSQINGTFELAKTGTPVQVTSLLNFLQIATRSNSLISALNTNTLVFLFAPSLLYMTSTVYFDRNAAASAYEVNTCEFINSTTPAGFYSLSYNESSINHQYWPENPFPPFYFEPNVSAMVSGFFAGCNPLDALLVSTLDCLYNINCLQLLGDYFPSLSQVCITVSFMSHENVFLSSQILSG
jgi:hypothetical protein